MDVRQLRCFVAVAEELHFGRAAARLHIAGPAVSQTIRSLEAELRLRLCERTNRRVELTDAGHLLLGEAHAVLGRLDGARAAMDQFKSRQQSQVRVGVAAALPPRLVPTLLATCAREATGVHVVVTALRAGGDRALGHDVELALVRGQPSEPGVESIVVVREPVGIALPRGHRLARRRTIRAAELNGVPLIAFARRSDPEEYDRLFASLANAGLTDVRLAHESHPGAVEASLRLVGAGAGVSPKLRSEVESFGSTAVVWRPLADAEIEVVIAAAWRTEKLTPAVESVVSVLRTLAGSPSDLVI
jgi:LysR family transcriptional regulator, benzoate and cis,cis-muconate-responsive activator of ben and cat genes